MIPSAYYYNGVTYLEELVESLSTTDKERLLELLSTLPKEERIEWRKKNNKEILSYAEATPNQRTKKKKWNKDNDYRLLLVFYSYRYLSLSVRLMENLANQPRWTNGPYRKACVAGVRVALNLVEDLNPLPFPFDGKKPWYPNDHEGPDD